MPILLTISLAAFPAKHHVHKRPYTVILDIVAPHDGDGGNHPDLDEQHDGDVCGDRDRQGDQAPRPVRKPEVPAFVFCHRMRALTFSESVPSRIR